MGRVVCVWGWVDREVYINILCKSNSSQKPATNYLLLRDINSCSQLQNAEYVEILIG